MSWFHWQPPLRLEKHRACSHEAAAAPHLASPTCCVALSTSSCHWLLGSVWRGSEPCRSSASIWPGIGHVGGQGELESRLRVAICLSIGVCEEV